MRHNIIKICIAVIFFVFGLFIRPYIFPFVIDNSESLFTEPVYPPGQQVEDFSNEQNTTQYEYEVPSVNSQTQGGIVKSILDNQTLVVEINNKGDQLEARVRLITATQIVRKEPTIVKDGVRVSVPSSYVSQDLRSDISEDKEILRELQTLQVRDVPITILDIQSGDEIFFEYSEFIAPATYTATSIIVQALQ